ncbi:MAG: AAA family ATPase [Pseudomonadota bacterium]
MKSPAEYQGMRWLKCDLHVHTPEDGRHWNEETFRLSSPRSEEDLQEKARRFLRHCHALRLDCIAVTDHNFSAETDPRRWFLTHLIEQNNTVADAAGREPLVIFPGFELDIRYHVLCLFHPVNKGKRLQDVSDILTNMDLAPGSRFTSGVPQQPKHHGQCWSLREVLDKVQGEAGGIVIAAHAFSSDGICNAPANIPDFVNNPDLYAIEANSWPFGEKARAILDGSNGSWRRKRPHVQPAPVCGSDGKSLDDSACANTLGCRFTWIEMSDPSCESLRQAFLDWESRTCFDPEPPQVDHAHIRKILVSGTKFLQDQAVALSPHLNCLIGGRGSGKSMLFESIRLGLRGEMPFKDVDERDHVAAKQVRRLRNTFTPSTSIALEVSHGGVEDRFLVDHSGQPARIEGREVDDPPTVFRQLNALIFSQEEITQLADRQKSLIDFIDNLAVDRLASHGSKAREITDKLRAGWQIEATLGRIEGELAILKQEAAELARQLDAKAQVQEELNRHRAGQDASRYLDGLLARSREFEERLSVLADELESEPPPLGSRVQTFPEKTFFERVEASIGEAYREVAGSIRASSEKFRREIEMALHKNPDWEKVQTAIGEAEERFKRACREKGLTTQEAERLRETELQHRAKQAALQAKEAERTQVERQKPDMLRLYRELTDCWLKETGARQEVLNDISTSKSMPCTEAGDPIVKTTITFAGDRATFLKQWGELAPDRRTAVGRTWDRYARDGGRNNIGDQLFEAFQSSFGAYQSSDVPGNPFLWLEANWERDDNLPALVRQYLDEIKLVRLEKAGRWYELLLTRIPDAADLTLLRRDGTEAGSFQKEDLSTGQKNTAILSLLLARGNGPVLIDQPEDELDSEFLFRELVPMFRSAKMNRQLIIVTHNANIPVNGDAELVYALEAHGGRGVCRSQGGLDRPEVTRAVLDIMEGSEEAFRRRKEKYHF